MQSYLYLVEFLKRTIEIKCKLKLIGSPFVLKD